MTPPRRTLHLQRTSMTATPVCCGLRRVASGACASRDPGVRGAHAAVRARVCEQRASPRAPRGACGAATERAQRPHAHASPEVRSAEAARPPHPNSTDRRRRLGALCRARRAACSPAVTPSRLHAQCVVRVPCQRGTTGQRDERSACSAAKAPRPRKAPGGPVAPVDICTRGCAVGSKVFCIIITYLPYLIENLR